MYIDFAVLLPLCLWSIAGFLLVSTLNTPKSLLGVVVYLLLGGPVFFALFVVVFVSTFLRNMRRGFAGKTND